MGTTTLQVNFNDQRMIDLKKIKKHRRVPDEKGEPGYLSDDTFARTILLEKIDEELKKLRK